MEVLDARRNDVLVLALKEMTLLEQSTKQVLSRLSKRPRSARHPVKRELLRTLAWNRRSSVTAPSPLGWFDYKF
jgi:hypothetical protein